MQNILASEDMQVLLTFGTAVLLTKVQPMYGKPQQSSSTAAGRFAAVGNPQAWRDPPKALTNLCSALQLGSLMSDSMIPASAPGSDQPAFCRWQTTISELAAAAAQVFLASAKKSTNWVRGADQQQQHLGFPWLHGAIYLQSLVKDLVLSIIDFVAGSSASKQHLGSDALAAAEEAACRLLKPC